VNTPSVTVGVILDSAQGLHQGGQVCAPVFQRVTQQVLEYIHVAHDTEFKPETRRQLLAAVKDRDLDEEAPDHVGEALHLAEVQPPAGPANNTVMAAAPMRAGQGATLVSAAITSSSFIPTAQAATTQPAVSTPLMPPAQPGPVPTSGVVVNVDGALVPSFLGKSLRSAIEAAQQAGIVLDAHGSGIAREQSPSPGTRIPPGGRVAVRFAR
jgi:hypothetical protein